MKVKEDKYNYLLGDFKITNLTKRPAGETKIELEFILTTDLILLVNAEELNREDQKKMKQEMLLN